MKERVLIELLDSLETARIIAGAEMERLCNENKHTQACVFQAIRDSLAQNINLLQSYNTLYGKLKEKNNNIGALEQIKWERDIAVDQLKELGYSLGEKPKTGH